MNGKGSIKDIYITSAYALTPIIIIYIPITILSNYLVLEEGTFYYFFIYLATIWSICLLFLGTMVVHEYELGETIFTSILTIIGMGCVLFLGLLFFNLFDQVVLFIMDVFSEITLRM
jgi:hypothetical protein